ncbi:MAG: TonB-dependent receptor [Bacteroidales bacterium]
MNRLTKILSAVLIPILIGISFSAFAQKSYPLSGTIRDVETNEVIPFAMIQIENSQEFCMSDASGFFKFNKFPLKETTLKISFLGYITKKIIVSKTIRKEILVINLQPANLSIDEVIVTAKRVDSREGTSSIHIGTDAIKQVQTFSLSDLVSLLPGNKLTPPTLNSTQQIQLRSAEDGGSSINSFGTSIVIDGVPINNDANMQALDPATSSSGVKSTANAGVDLRDIPTSNIESVEVITGVPSAKYGNLTSGTVLVKRKAGYTPLSIRFNTTPNSYQGGLSQGLSLGPKWGFLNYDADYTYSTSSTTDNSHYYNRYSGGLRWTFSPSQKHNWTNTTSLNVNYNKDGERTEADKTDYNHSSSENYGVNLSINGSIALLGRINYSASGSISKQNTNSEVMGTGPVPLVSIDSSGTYMTEYSPISFMTERSVEGIPINFYARSEANQSLETGDFHLDFSTGFEYSYNKNRGKGLITAGNVVSSANLPGSRGLNFHEVPASTMLAVYHEFNALYLHNKWMYKARLGGRYDYMNSKYNLFSPRLSGGVKWNKEIGLRAAYGISYKAPSMLTLYPGPIYFDGINMSHYSSNKFQSMAIVTTEIYQPNNDYLKPSKGQTSEIGFTWDHNKWSLYLTGYYKILSNGIGRTDELFVMALQQYKINQEFQNKYPDVEAIPGDFVYLPFKQYKFNNNKSEKSKGIEWTITPPQIEATKTSFRLSGSYVTTNTYTDTPMLHQGNVISDAVGFKRYGLFSQSERRYDRCNANLTLIQRIPALRMVITLVTELNIYNNQDYLNSDRYPIGWYDQTGKYIEIPEAERMDEKYSDLVLSERTYQFEQPPFYPNFHLQIRKELKSGHSFSFFANNFLWYNPTYQSNITDSKITLNSKISFGFSASFKL